MDLIGLGTPATNPVFFVAWPLILAGTLLTAVLALIARTWAGWRKFAPLLVVLAVPAMLLLSRLLGQSIFVIFSISWTILGLAVMTSDAEVALQAARA